MEEEIIEFDNIGKYAENRLFKNLFPRRYTNNHFTNLIIENYIGDSFFLVKYETRKILLEQARKEFEIDKEKFNKRKYIEGNYSMSEILNGRRGKNGGIRNYPNKYSCNSCSKGFRLRHALDDHMKKEHKKTLFYSHRKYYEIEVKQ